MLLSFCYLQPIPRLGARQEAKVRHLRTSVNSYDVTVASNTAVTVAAARPRTPRIG